MVRAEREPNRRKREVADLLVLPRLAKSLQTSAEKLEHTEPGEKKRVALVPQKEPPVPKEKKNRAVCPKHQIKREERVKVGESRTLARERQIRAGAWRGKSGLHSGGRQIPRRRLRASKENLPRRSRRKHERVSERKSFSGRSTESWFYSKSGQT